MIISTLNSNPTVNIEVSLWQQGASTEPFIVRIASGNSIHMSLREAERLHLQLTAALYEYDNGYKYKETS